MDQLRFDCGCNFPVLDKTNQRVKLDIDKIPFTCKRTWHMLGKGLTKGVFQLESGLGKSWCKKLKPENMEHLAALGAILRPGVLRSVDENNISMTEHYCRRKNLEEPIEYYHPALESIVGTTYGIQCYQEQSMAIAKELAGFNLQEADELRKCITSDSLFVSQSRGYISLKDLLRTHYKKDKFLTMTHDGKQQWDGITNIWFTKKVCIIQINTKTGLFIQCTEDHKILTNNGWKMARDINIKDYLITSRQSNFIGRNILQDDLAVIIAGIICEGFCSNRSCTFVNHNKEMMDIYINACRSIFPDQYINTNNNKVAKLSKAATDLVYKFIKPVKSKYKELPVELLSCNKEQCRKYLSFMLACEGGITKSTGQFEFSSKSQKLIKQVNNLLRRFGIVSNMKKKIVPKYGIYYRLYINDITQQQLLKQELTCLWPKCKIDDLDHIIKNKSKFCFSSDLLPKNICQKFIEDGGKPKEGPANFLKRRVSFAKLKRIAHNYEWQEFARGCQYYDQVSSIKKLSPKNVYDFSMQNTNMPQAIVNNIVISNSIGKKLPEEMKKVEVKFLAGAIQTGILKEEEAKQIMEWIKESQRYSFNKCVSGDTIIKRMHKGKYPCILTVAEMYRVKTDIKYAKQTNHLQLYKKWKMKRNYGEGLSLQEDSRVRPNTIVDIQYAGKRPLYCIVTENNKSITVTDNHKFPTDNGIKTTKELMDGNHRLIICGQYEPIGEKGYPISYERISCITYVGEENTYDVTMEAPYHTFVTNDGIITCNSHAVSYAINGYYTAYCKAHFPLQFFTSWLSYAHYDAEPKQERKELIDEARLMDIQVLPPDICNLQACFHTDGKVITFGLSDIKGVGQANVKKIVDIVKHESKDIKEWTWLEVLSKFAPNGQVSILHKLACAGALRHYGNVRKQLINDIEAWENITKGQRLFIIQNISKFSNLLEALKNASLLKKEGGGTHSEACQRKICGIIQLLENPSTKTEDTPVWIADTEEILLGTSITCSRVDACDMSAINSTCRDFINDSANVRGAYILGVEIQDVNPTKTKKGNNPGQKMARIVMSDGTCALDAVVFPEQYKLYEDLLVKGNTVIVSGERDRRQGGFIVKKMYQANLLGTGEE